MKLLIDISEEEYKEVLEDTYSGTPFENKIFTIIAKGAPYEENESKEEYWWDIIEANRSLVNDRFDISRFNAIVRCPKCKTIRKGMTYYCSWCGSKMKWNGMPSQSAEEGTYLVPEMMEVENGQSDCSSDRSDA